MLRSRRLSNDQQLQRASDNNPPLKNGSTGDGVREMQDVLADLRYDLKGTFSKGRADGIFGPETDKAVRRFQQEQGLSVDGIAGRQTLTRLDEIILADKTLEIPDPTQRAVDDLSDRGRPIYRRSKANW